MTAPGWYGEPGNPQIERFWDGNQWTPQTRSAATSDDTSLELGPTKFEQDMASFRASRPVYPPAPPVAPPPPPPTQPAGRLQRMAEASERALRRPGDIEKVCPHCGVKGRITSRPVRRKKGISGGKATGAVLTGGISMLGTGLSRKEKGTEMHCHNCNTRWDV